MRVIQLWQVHCRSNHLNSRFGLMRDTIVYLHLHLMDPQKSDQNATAAARNINAAFVDDSVNDRTIRRWYAKFESGD
ncbi:UNVERIFIED_CONTAM: hypothetical protein NCL1_28161 [Trichonephila clavipes]